ncbi:glutamine synthetase family protein [Canibacter sp. lx-72]|uniref:glutamine synthetase family protein n=1 Tax=Canibacter zhuwentaonis TaxID=2837491 RepID=UPI001BDD2E9C|nr:glutamine synthetase family protein [Canibacter zhuwentaonis]
MSKQRDLVLRTLEERGVKFVRLWFTDIAGTLKTVALAPTEVESAFAEGIGFDGSAIEGLTRAFESDLLAIPDAITFNLLPWRGESEPTARMFCDLFTPNGEPAVSDPRQVLKRQLAKAAAHGFTFYTHPEIEFYLLEQQNDANGQPVPVDRAGYFDSVPGGLSHDFRRAAVAMLENLGIFVEFSHHEGGPGQNEIDLRYADALTMADNIMTFRAIVKEIAIGQGARATFMPKPFMQYPGSGMHTHLSLFEGEENAFFDAGAKYQLSITGRRFVAGLLRHAAEITAITNQYVNSYKRLWDGDEAPSYISWGHLNHSALVRIPMYKTGKKSSVRVEHRGLDPACNPYLAYAVLLAAGLKGITEEYELPPEAEENIWAMSTNERRVMGFDPLPRSLDEALKIMEGSELIAETLGEQAFVYFLRDKKREIAEYHRQVTQWELEKNLDQL